MADSEQEKTEGIRLADAGNTQNPAVLVLRARGYKLRAQLDENEQICNYWAYRDSHEFVADSPVALLGLTAIYEHFGADWQQGLKDFVLYDLPTFSWYYKDDNGDESLVYDGDDEDKRPQ